MASSAGLKSENG